MATEARNPIQRRWERLPGPLQFLIAFFVWFWIFWVGHVKLLNQPVGRGFLYGIFWGGTPSSRMVAANERVDTCAARKKERLPNGNGCARMRKDVRAQPH